jgi:hypothetical protein
MLTKGTFYPYVAPFAVLYLVLRVFQGRWRQGVANALCILVSILALNSGFWIRNIRTFGGFLGPQEWISSRTGQGFKPAALASRVLRNVVLNYASPWQAVNDKVEAWVEGSEEIAGLSGEKFELQWLWNQEDVAGNPIHFSTFLLASPVWFVYSRRHSRAEKLYGVAAIGSFLSLCLIVTYDPFGVRYQLPFLFLWAPLFATTTSQLVRGGSQRWIAAFFLAASVPWLLFNTSRPLIGFRDGSARLSLPCNDTLGCTRIGSILVENPARILFANFPEKRSDYSALANQIVGLGCSQVGLRIDSHDPEYLFWWVLDSPQSGRRLDSIYFSDRLRPYQRPDLVPCAVICTICGDRDRLHGLPRIGTFGDAALFAGRDFTAEEDG